MTRTTLLALTLAACGGDDGGGDPPIFPENYEASYQMVRNCRNSLEHDLRRVTVWAGPDAVTPYTGRAAPFPVGSIVLKVEHDDNDPMCLEPPIGYTVMQKLAAGANTAMLDWDWVEYDGDFKKLDTPPASCVNCHKNCEAPPDGYDATCTDP